MVLRQGSAQISGGQKQRVGAAIQGGVLGGTVKDVLLLDVTPLSLGSDNARGVMRDELGALQARLDLQMLVITHDPADAEALGDHVVVPRMMLEALTIAMTATPSASPSDSALPLVTMATITPPPSSWMVTSAFTAPRVIWDTWPASWLRADSFIDSLGRPISTRVPAAPEPTTAAKEQSIRIQSSGGLSEDQIQNMVRDAETFAQTDKARKEMIELKNEADTSIYSTEKSLAEYKAKLPQAVVDEINAAIAEARSASSGEDATVLKEKVTALSKAAMKIGETLAQQSGGGSSGGGGSSDSSSGGGSSGGSSSGPAQ
ncbi:MAG: hypothetical protein WDW38_003663 [Sanguina aurantia]